MISLTNKVEAERICNRLIKNQDALPTRIETDQLLSEIIRLRSLNESWGARIQQLAASAESLRKENSKLLTILQNMTDVFSPFSSSDSERYREECQVFDAAVAQLREGSHA